MHIVVQVQLVYLLVLFFPSFFLSSNYLDSRMQKSFVRLFKNSTSKYNSRNSRNQANCFHRTVSSACNGIIVLREFCLLFQPKIVQYHWIPVVRFPFTSYSHCSASLAKC